MRTVVETLLLVLVLAGFTAITAQPRKTATKPPERIALVIGNGTYEKLGPLKHPKNDANDIAEALRSVGFKVHLGVNQTFREMVVLIDEFTSDLANTKGIGVVFYSGYAFNVDYENYLLPFDTRILTERDSLKEGVSLSELFAKLNAASNAGNLVFLDAVASRPFVPFWTVHVDGILTPGFAEVNSLPKNTVVVHTSRPFDIAGERCGRNGYFTLSFLNQLNKPDIDSTEMLKLISAELADRSFGQQVPLIKGNLPVPFSFNDEAHRLAVPLGRSLSNYFDQFKAANKCSCGQRDDLRIIGRSILENYADDTVNKDVIEYVEKRLASDQVSDQICAKDYFYEETFKSHNWRRFFEAGKMKIASAKNPEEALDIMLELVSVGIDRVVEGHDDDFKADTLFFAAKALEQLDAKVSSKKYGANLRQFDSEPRARGWCNYVIGYIKYFPMNRRDDAIAYFYKAYKIGFVFDDDWTLLQIFGNYYFDIAMGLFENYQELRKANLGLDSDRTRAVLSLALGYADRSIDAYGRARGIYKSPRAKISGEKVVFKDNLDEIYVMRFNFVPKMPTWGMEDFITDLNSRPMPDPRTKVVPVPII